MIRKLVSDKRESFLDAALRLFVANGVQNTSTGAIAREAGTASGTLFLYFPTKQDLMNELVIRIGREQSEYMKTLIDPSQSAHDMFLTIWTGSIRWFLENLDAYQYVEQVRDTGLVGEDVAQESDKFFGYYYDAIKKGLKEGALKSYPIELIGGILYQDIAAIVNLLRAQPNSARQEKIIQQGFTIFWDGIKARDTKVTRPAK